MDWTTAEALRTVAFSIEQGIYPITLVVGLVMTLSRLGLPRLRVWNHALTVAFLILAVMWAWSMTTVHAIPELQERQTYQWA